MIQKVTFGKVVFILMCGLIIAKAIALTNHAAS